MSIQVIIELADQSAVQTLIQALETYKRHLRESIRRTKARLSRFEEQYNVSTAQFLSGMVAEDLAGGDLEYVEWAGEASLLDGLQAELAALEHARHQLS
ncbi:MAG: hypothetical protein DCC55_01610 [Chloroflexi bacterium]|nr:MAG: hypothetical protein DCC55_01610 [Chloroflexota bacterium]